MLVMVSVPVKDPVAGGVKATETTQENPGFSGWLQLELAILKALPLMVVAVMLSGA